MFWGGCQWRRKGACERNRLRFKVIITTTTNHTVVIVHTPTAWCGAPRAAQIAQFAPCQKLDICSSVGGSFRFVVEAGSGVAGSEGWMRFVWRLTKMRPQNTVRQHPCLCQCVQFPCADVEKAMDKHC